jgi:hypothetical protein
MIATWSRVRRDPAIGASTGAAAVRAVVGAHHEALNRAPEGIRALYRLMFEAHGELTPLRADIATMDSEQRALMAALLANGQRRGQVTKAANPERSAVLVLAVLRGIVMQWLVDPDAIAIDDIYGELDGFLLRGFAP